jgi:hypothetical protein
MNLGPTLLILCLIGALYFGAMANMAKYHWFDVERTTQFAFIAIGFTIATMIIALVML